MAVHMPGRSEERNWPYRSLDTEQLEIRIATIEPASHDAPIRCRLQSVCLSDSKRPPYETISYCWGDTVRSMSIDIDGASIRIPETAGHVLRELRSPGAERTVWLDSICINQSDAVERSQQVQIMHLVFGNGWRNIVWLGPDDDGTAHQSLVALSQILEDVMQGTNRMNDFHNVLFTPEGRFRRATVGLSVVPDFQSLCKLLQRPWFTRLWVVQEAALARSNTCRLGPYEFPLIDVLRAAMWLNYKCSTLPRGWISAIRPKLNCCARLFEFVDAQFGRYQRQYYEEKQPISLSMLLCTLRNFTASEPRDYVYGTLGLYQAYSRSHRSMSWPRLPWTLRPDYLKPVEQVFRDAAKEALSDQAPPCLLRLLHTRQEDLSEDSGLPTWVPRLDRPLDPFRDPRQFTSFTSADNQTQMQVLRPSAGETDILKLKGVLGGKGHGDVISSVSGCARSAADFPDILNDIREMLQCISQDAHMDILPTEFGKLLLGNRNAEGAIASVDDAKDFDVFFRLFTGQDGLSLFGGELRHNDQLSEAQRRRAKRYAESFLQAFKHRRFFTTMSGGLGIGPQGVDPGDVVAVFYGVKMPFVLRPRGAEYRIVGECYVHGIMNGEAVRAHERQGRDDILFRLR